jgi:cell division protein FtsB
MLNREIRNQAFTQGNSLIILSRFGKTQIVPFDSKPINLYVSNPTRSFKFQKIQMPDLSDFKVGDFEIINEKVISLHKLLPPIKLLEYKKNNNQVEPIDNTLKLPCIKDKNGKCIDQSNVIVKDTVKGFDFKKTIYSNLLSMILGMSLSLLFYLVYVFRKSVAKNREIIKTKEELKIEEMKKENLKKEEEIKKMEIKKSLQISDNILGKGSNGTVVFEGKLGGRKVAIKRLLKEFNDIAYKEIQLLIESDTHPNVVRYYSKDEDHQFVYLVLEHCEGNLHELTINFNLNKDKKEIIYEMLNSVEHLHSINIVHRDIKPHNILFTKEGSIKLSDMGLGKK